MNINNNNNNIILKSSSPQRKRTLSEGSNSSNSKRSCSIDNSSSSQSPSPTTTTTTTTSTTSTPINTITDNQNLSSSISSLGTSKLNLMDRITPPAEQFELDPFDDANVTIRPISSPNSTHNQQQQQDDEEEEEDTNSLPAYSTLSSLTLPASPPLNRPEPSAQIAIIKDFKNNELEVGENWYLISRDWYRKWETVCSGIAESKEDDLSLTIDDIGGIDNSKITNEKGELREGVLEGVDAIIVDRTTWELLKGWYGVAGKTFERVVVKTAEYGSERVEFYPPTFQFQILLSSTSPSSTSPPSPLVSFSSGTRLKVLKDYARELYSLNGTGAIRFWRSSETTLLEHNYILADRLSSEEGIELVETEGSGITDQSRLSESLLDNQMNRLIVEQEVDGKWLVDASQIVSDSTPATSSTASVLKTSEAATVDKKKLFGKPGFFGTMEKSTNTLIPRNKSAMNSNSKAIPITVPSNSSSSGFLSTLSGALTRSKSTGRSGGQRGLTGLQNLGNTCFMNSALQCMSNTKELQEYFLSGVYKNELNPDNPLGMNGQVAEAFGQLIERLWSTSGGSVPPREFKQALSKFAPSFSGYGQQDSQELLAFLLDGTHEDLNRIKVKPATNAPDWAMGGGDQELVDLARVCWEQYRSRNDSVIVDLFQGQYRSTVVCPDCDKVSITFDPFMYVTTNLPVMKKWTGKVFYIPLDVTKNPVHITLELPKTATIKSAKVAIGNFMNCEAKNLVVCEVWKGKFWKAWYDDDIITELQPNDVVCFFESTAPFAQLKPRIYGKVKPTPIPIVNDVELPILIAVTHTVKRDRSFKKLTSDKENFGSPFLLILTRAEASTKEGIEKALLIQYGRFSKRGAELFSEGEVEDTMDISRNDTPAATSLSPLPLTTILPEPMEVDGPSSVTSIPTPPEDDSTTFIEDITTSASVLPQPIVEVEARRSPFEILVSKSPKKENALPFENSDHPTYPIPLSARAFKGSSPDIFTTSSTILPGSYYNDSTTTDINVDDDDPMTIETVVTEALPPTEVVPLLFNGDSIVTEWVPEAYEYFFGSGMSTWDEIDEFIDPLVVEALDKKAKGGKKQSITIEDCLREFTKEERLGEDDTWYCPDCKKHQQATKKVEIWKVPDVLVFALKRFSASRYSRDKIDDLVTFPVEGFNMEPFVEGDKVEKRLALNGSVVVDEAESLIYDLYAVDNHYGGLGGGHYTAYAKNHENGKWYDFDDSRVSEIADTRIQTSAAYLLFYRRRTARPIGAKSRELVDSALQSRAASTAVSRGVSPSVSHQHSPSSSIDDTVNFTNDSTPFIPLSSTFIKSFSSTSEYKMEEKDGFMLPFKSANSDSAEPGTPRSNSPYTPINRLADEDYDELDDLDPTADFPSELTSEDQDGAGILDDDSAYDFINRDALGAIE